MITWTLSHCVNGFVWARNFRRRPTTTASLTTSQRQRAAAVALRQRYELEATQPLVALNTAATNSRAKCWPEDRFAALADELITHENARVVLIGAESERANAERVVQQMKTDGALNLAGRTSMAELLGLLESCALLVTNDTGPAHVAAALGRPTLTLFGPTNEFETAPAGPYAELMRADGIECARCMHRECPIDHRCMTRLTVAEVFSRARSLLRSASAL
ncbi:MAG: glycosyltransferase family 9 protein [Acidobacteriota bacterium]